MRIIIYIVILVVLLHLINYLWLMLYCRIESKIDKIQNEKGADANTDNANLSESSDLNVKKLIKIVYKYLDHYMYGWMRYWVIKTGRIPSNRVRKFLYKYVFKMKLGRKTVISGGCEIRSPWNIELGSCIIAGGCLLDGRSGIKICDNAVLGMYVHIWTQEHDINSPDFAVTAAHKGKVTIESRAWICSDSTILPGTLVGEGAVVAAKACVTKNCEDFGVYGGVPARKIGIRNNNLQYELKGSPHWHFN